MAKGQIIREIDALGGSAEITDKTMIQFKMLNKSKDLMWSPRAQSDRIDFANEWRWKLESLENLDFWQDMVTDLWIKDDRVLGVMTSLGLKIKSKCTILTNGTFLNGKIHIGQKNFRGGRSVNLRHLDYLKHCKKLVVTGRMKTGTPPRLDGRTIDFSKLEQDSGDDAPGTFNFLNRHKIKDQIPCYIAYTNNEVTQF